MIKIMPTYISEYFHKNNKLHNENGPAKIIRYKKSKSYEEYYYKNGKRHRIDGPALIIHSHEINKSWTIYYNNGKKHRIDGPAYISYENNKVHNEYYYIKGICYKKINYYNNHIMEQHFENEKLHNENGPALIRYRDNNIIYTEYRKHGYLHREDGPACISIDYNNCQKFYYINGKNITNLVRDNPEALTDRNLLKILT